MFDKKGTGMFVVFEGIDGAGTSTQLIKLIEHLEEKDKYQDVLRTHEPWRNNEIRQRLKEDKDAYSGAEKMAELYVSDRESHSSNLIYPALRKGIFVLCDRYSMSTCAYQWAQGIDLDKLIKMHEGVEILIPDITFFVNVSVEIAQERISKRDKREKFEDWDFQKRVLESYHELVKRAHNNYSIFGKVSEINGRGSIDEVAGRVSSAFNPVYEEWKNS